MTSAPTTMGVWLAPEAFAIGEVGSVAEAIEGLGYETLWYAETFGRDPFALGAYLGTQTSRLRIATGIANIYNRHAGVMKQGAYTLAEMTSGRFTLGLGVSSPDIVVKARGADYSRPLSRLAEYLDQYEKGLYFSVPPLEPPPIVLAALGPKMLGLARSRDLGVLTYNVTPEHTARAREALGPTAYLAVEQKVILSTDADLARATAASTLKFYRRAPGYRRAWNALGFTDEDIDTPTERYLDAVVAWGTEEQIRARLDEHLAAGASHVCIQPLHPDSGILQVDHDALRAFAPSA